MISIGSLSFQTPSRQLATPMAFAMVRPADAEIAAAAPASRALDARRTFAPGRPTLTDGLMAALIEAQAAYA